MIYRVLLVDDELPALRFVQSIIDKYLPEFRVDEKCTSAEAALHYLQAHPVDVLITDISMGQMNGIELAKEARKLFHDLHIVIISGYGEFDYAQGAIEAAVCSYILKPVSIPRVRQTMESIRDKLDAQMNHKASLLFPAVACDHSIDSKMITCFAGMNYRFAYLQWGGTEPNLPSKLVSSSLMQPVPNDHWVLRGRTENEQIVIFPDIDTDAFLSELSVCLSSRSDCATWTAIWHPDPMPLTALPIFIRQVIPLLPLHTIIGKHRILSLNTKQPLQNYQLSSDIIARLNYYISTQKTEGLKSLMLDVAIDWERRALSQQLAWKAVKQMIQSASNAAYQIASNADNILSVTSDLFIYASSYGELLAGLYETFLDCFPNDRKRKFSTEELYQYASRYIDEHYAEPISVQDACDELGISKTYLSRLFRKYSDTTFNTSLTRKRMEKAQELLTSHPDMLLRDVAACVGYEDSSYFSKVFHQFTGMKPSEYSV